MISVIMAVKNGAATLEAAIQSILTQTYQDFELLIIDDCSDDRSYEIIETFAKKSAKIKRKKNATKYE